MSEELLPCPCCGTRAKLQQVPMEPETPNSGGYYIECQRSACGLTSRLAFALKDDPIPELVEAWNRRSPVSDPQREQICRNCGGAGDSHYVDPSVDPVQQCTECGGTGVISPPAGFVSVPVEPTFEMLIAGTEAGFLPSGVRKLWSAMIAASPAPQATAPLQDKEGR